MKFTFRSMRFLLAVSAVLLFLLSFSYVKYSKRTYFLNYQIPGVVKVNDTFFCDQAEVANVDWREYVYWNAMVFGKNSREYKEALPDTTVWIQIDSSLIDFVSAYYRNPNYNFYPVVGISQKQAKDFCKWRSDRLFERLLIDKKLIEKESLPTKESYFSIERYYTGKFEKVLYGDKLEYYPDFRLPDMAERNIAIQFADEVDKKFFDKCDTRYCADCSRNYPKIQTADYLSQARLSSSQLLVSVNTNCSAQTSNAIYNLKGNVGEWSALDSITFGGGWRDRRSVVLATDTFTTVGQNAWTGFRAVCTWKKWE